MLLGARRKQVLLAIDIENVIVQTDEAILLPNKTLKHTNPKHPPQPFVYHSFSENENLYCDDPSGVLIPSTRYS